MMSNFVGRVILFCCVISLVTEINTFEFQIHQKSPVILIPGFFGSQLEAKLDQSVVKGTCAEQNSTFFNIWLNIAYLSGHSDCWYYSMRLVYNNETRKTRDPEGVTLRVPGWGDPTVVEYLDNTRDFVPYFRYLMNMLIDDMGYIRNVSLRAAPYDFRKGPAEHEDYFSKLKVLVEETYEINNELPVTLISHSMGSPMSLIFLQRQSQSWKDKYINSLISLAGAWGGSVKSLKVAAVGDNFDYPLFFYDKEIRTLLTSYPSLAFLLPSKLFWNNEVLIESTSKNYTLADLKDYFERIEHSNLWEFHKDNERYKLNFTSPGMKVYCLYGTNVDTFEKLHYQSEVNPNGEPMLVLGDGDGTVNLRSLEGCKHWIGKQEQKIYYQALPKVGHLDILENKNVLNYIKNNLAVVIDSTMTIDCVTIECDLDEQNDLDNVNDVYYDQYDVYDVDGVEYSDNLEDLNYQDDQVSC